MIQNQTMMPHQWKMRKFLFSNYYEIVFVHIQHSTNLHDSYSTANNAPEKSIVLPSATELLHGNTNTKGGVFNNPYKEAELAFSASLSKHVEMVKILIIFK